MFSLGLLRHSGILTGAKWEIQVNITVAPWRPYLSGLLGWELGMAVSAEARLDLWSSALCAGKARIRPPRFSTGYLAPSGVRPAGCGQRPPSPTRAWPSFRPGARPVQASRCWSRWKAGAGQSRTPSRALRPSLGLPTTRRAPRTADTATSRASCRRLPYWPPSVTAPTTAWHPKKVGMPTSSAPGALVSPGDPARSHALGPAADQACLHHRLADMATLSLALLRHVSEFTNVINGLGRRGVLR
jgi:hypothetical protein